MPVVTIRDDSLWAKHIHEGSIREKVLALQAGDRIKLIVDGNPIVFRKMNDGKDGRPTPGLKADEDDLAGRMAWKRLQERRGDAVDLQIENEKAIDPYLAYLDEFFWEWKTPEDSAAFDDL